MTRSFRTDLALGLTTMACVMALAACGSSPPSTEGTQHTQSTQNSPPPGQADTAICHVVSEASLAYTAKDYAAWRADLVRIAGMADSAQYEPIKQVAIELKSVLASSSVTTTTKPGKKYKPNLNSNLKAIFGPLGAYVDLTKTCAHLPT
jgi:hypothetical protein